MGADDYEKEEDEEEEGKVGMTAGFFETLYDRAVCKRRIRKKEEEEKKKDFCQRMGGPFAIFLSFPGKSFDRSLILVIVFFIYIRRHLNYVM